jgi:photosystem II stability/assembly factor-like uncharacterized protein
MEEYMEDNKSLIRHDMRIDPAGLEVGPPVIDHVEAEIIDETKPQPKWAYVAVGLLLVFVVGASVYLLIREEPVAGKIASGAGAGRWIATNIKAGSAFNSVQGSDDFAVAQGSDGQSFVTQDGGRTWRENLLGKPIVSPANNGLIVVPWGGIVDGQMYVAETSVEGGFYGAIHLIPASGIPGKIWEGEYGQIVGGSRHGGWLVGTRGLILHLRNGQWAPAKVSTTGCGTPDFNAVAVSPNVMMAVGAEGRVVRSMDKGEHWVCDKVSPARETRAFFAVDLNDQWELIGGQGGAFYIRRGDAWSEIPGLDGSLSIQAIMIDGDTGFVAGGRQGYNDTPFILFSRDQGRNWELEQIGANNLSGMIVGVVKLTNGYFAVTSDGQILQRKS